jgi:hypothetical protein
VRGLVYLLSAVLAGCSSPRLPRAEASRTYISATPAPDPDALPSNVLAWDALAKEYRAKPGDETAEFTFNVTNVSAGIVVILDTSTSCGCTVAELPRTPWPLEPGAGGQIRATMDLSDKQGTVTRDITVFTSRGNQLLTVTADVPD